MNFANIPIGLGARQCYTDRIVTLELETQSTPNHPLAHDRVLFQLERTPFGSKVIPALNSNNAETARKFRFSFKLSPIYRRLNDQTVTIFRGKEFAGTIFPQVHCPEAQKRCNRKGKLWSNRCHFE